VPSEEAAFVVLMRVHLHFPQSGSLKAKRSELNRVKAHLRERMGASVAEVAHQDTWQRSTLAVAFAEGSPGRCEEAADRVQRMLDASFPQGVRVERRVASWADLGEVA
jgi:uncharacterized protein YlxP (DUF503 family)